jgi:hypothetical protein
MREWTRSANELEVPEETNQIPPDTRIVDLYSVCVIP